MNGFRNKIPGGSLIGRGAVLGKMLSVMEERGLTLALLRNPLDLSFKPHEFLIEKPATGSQMFWLFMEWEFWKAEGCGSLSWQQMGLCTSGSQTAFGSFGGGAVKFQVGTLELGEEMRWIAERGASQTS